MQFSDTTNKNGLIQTIERWTGLGDAGISGNSTLLKQFTSSINDAFDTLVPSMLALSDFLRWDDLNHTDLPIGTFNIVASQADYTVLADDNSLDILNISNVKILTSSSATQYQPLQRITIDSELATNALSPNSQETGVPWGFLEKGNTIFLYPTPNYSATNGAKIFFEREPSYFASTDTTKEPGIPKPFHILLALYPALDYVLIYKPENGNLITRLEAKIERKEKELSDLLDKRNPIVRRMSVGMTRRYSGSGIVGWHGSDSTR